MNSVLLASFACAFLVALLAFKFGRRRGSAAPSEVVAQPLSTKATEPSEPLPSFAEPDEGDVGDEVTELRPAAATDSALRDLAVLDVDEVRSGGWLAPTVRTLASAAADSARGGRASNDDAWAILGDSGVYVVADGVGIGRGGNVASALAIDVLTAHLAKHGGSPSNREAVTRLVEAFDEANRQVRARASASPELSAMATTLTALEFSPQVGVAWLAHVGDGRCYRLRRGELTCLTRDHRAAGTRTAITRAVGAEARLLVDIIAFSVEQGDTFLLCTDGLPRALSDAELREMLDADGTLEDKSRALVARAQSAAGDNATVVVVHVDEIGVWLPGPF